MKNSTAISEHAGTTGKAHGALPPGWQWLPFGEIAQSITDRIDDPAKSTVSRYVGLEHLDSESLTIRRWGVPQDVEATKLRFKKGDIIFGRRRAYQRKLAVAEWEGICSAHALVLRARHEKILSELLPFLMQSNAFMEMAVAISVGSLSPTINWSTLREQAVPVPPLKEQPRLVEMLMAGVTAVEADVNLLNAARASRQPLVDDLLDGPLLRNCARQKLKDVCSMQNGRPFPSSEYQSEGMRLLRPGNLNRTGFISWAADSTVAVPKRYESEAADFVLSGGDVVINLTAQSLEEGFIGRVCLLRAEDRSLLNQRIGRFRCTDEIAPEFLFRALQTGRFRKLVEAKCEGSKVRHTYFRHFESFEVPVPNGAEQDRVIQVCRAIDGGCAAALARHEATRHLLSYLRQRLLWPMGGDDGLQ
jgi:type I restriction enzyme S subunit